MHKPMTSLIAGLKRDDSTSYIRNGVKAWLTEDDSRRRHHIAKSIGVKRNYITMLCDTSKDDKQATRISIKLIPRLAKAVPTINAWELMLYRVKETWEPESMEILDSLFQFLMPNKEEQALLDAMEQWAQKIPGLDPLSAEDIRSNIDVLHRAFDQILDQELKASSC